MGYGNIVLAGHNVGSTSRFREWVDRNFHSFIVSLWSESFIVGKNKSLLKIGVDSSDYEKVNIFKKMYSLARVAMRLSKDEQKKEVYLRDGKPFVIDKVIDALEGAYMADDANTVCVGPYEPLQKLIGKRASVVAQGEGLDDNVQRGIRHLYKNLGYDKDFFGIICGDVSAITSKAVDSMYTSFEKRNDGKSTHYCAFGTREELAKLVQDYALEKYGKMGLMYFPFIPGRLNKFAIPFLDDVGLVSDEERSNLMMFGNMHVIHNNLNKYKDGVSYLTSLKHVFFSFKALRLIHRHVGLWNSARSFYNRKFRVSEIEPIISRAIQEKGFDEYLFKMVYTRPEAILDIDSWKDHDRNNALIAGRDKSD
jgi:hypothetical protein